MDPPCSPPWITLSLSLYLSHNFSLNQSATRFSPPASPLRLFLPPCCRPARVVGLMVVAKMRSSMALMAALLLLLVSLAAAYGERSEEETRRMFMEWMAEYGKTYNTISEEERRYAVFKDELRDIDQHNTAADAGVYPYTIGLNQFSDLTFEEWRARYYGGLLTDRHPVTWKKKGAAVAEI